MEQLKLVLLKSLVDLLYCSTYLSTGQDKSMPEHLLNNLAACTGDWVANMQQHASH